MKNSGLFLNMAKWYFLGVCFFEVLILKVCFWCVWYCFKSVKNACFFPSCLGLFSGVAHCCSSGFGRFRCFCVSCVCFSFLSCFCFCFVCFVLGFVVGFGPPHMTLKPSLFYLFLFFPLFCFVFLFFLFFFVCFFGGFKGQVRWPKGPPHLALNPPYFICFRFFFFVFFCLFFLCLCFC